jgi:hypothetical protein
MYPNSKFNRDGYYRVRTKSEMPTENHYAVIEYGSTYIPGDERSRTNPGHGYPARTEYHVEYIVFESRETWEIYIRLKGASQATEITPIYVTTGKIAVETKVSINLPV